MSRLKLFELDAKVFHVIGKPRHTRAYKLLETAVNLGLVPAEDGDVIQ